MSHPSTPTAQWQRSAKPAVHGGYVAWEASHMTAAQPGSAWYLPVFLRARGVSGGPGDLVAALQAVLTMETILMARDERDTLAAEVETAGPGWPHEVRFVGYLLTSDLSRLPDFCEILHIGAPVVLRQASRLGQRGDRDKPLPLPQPGRADEARPRTLIAAIDDGIAFLNARFRSDPRHTRFAGVWLQAPEILDPAGVLCGRTLFGDEIDTLLGGGEAEADIYRGINRDLLPGTERQSTNHLVSHGTHVLDLAAGAAPQGPDDAEMRALPILAVQLPPAALRDTSGRRLEGYVAQGLRWLMAQTLRRAAGGPVAPLVVNLSLGSLAGPGNDSAFLANWFSYEVERYARLAPDSVLRIVVAYGNARRARLVARSELRAPKVLALDWCILPDDHTPSFVELRADNQRAGALRLILDPPGEAIAPLDLPWPEPGESWSVGQPAIAMVTGVTEIGQRMVHVAVSPTAGAATIAPSGRWRIRVASNDPAPALISIRVQRDDTPAGYRILGRQSWLDHPQAWDWDDETRDWTAPVTTGGSPTDCPVSREGTAVAFAGTKAEAVFFVGSVRPVTGQPADWRPALYTASGVVTFQPAGESKGPTLAARGDDGAVTGGRRASGVLSGTTARLSGTSVATPCVTRALALYHDRTYSPTTLDAELTALLGAPRREPRSALVGYGVLAQKPSETAAMV